MKFTLERAVLLNMVEKSCGPFRSKKARRASLRLSACAARVFLHGPAAIASHEALVFLEGECQVRAWMFLEILKSYSGRTRFTLDADQRGIALDNSVIPIELYSPRTAPPAHFRVFPVTDLAVLGPKSIQYLPPGELPEAAP